MTTADVIAAMSAASVPAADISATSQLLESIESAEYGAADSANTGNIIAIATELIGASCSLS